MSPNVSNKQDQLFYFIEPTRYMKNAMKGCDVQHAMSLKIYLLNKNITAQIFFKISFLTIKEIYIYTLKQGVYNSILSSSIPYLHCAPSVSHCIHSFKQQSQWLILRSICYCMAEGSCAVHTCPATCLHHRARAGRDSVC